MIQLATHAPVDISRETNGDVMMLLTAKFDSRPEMAIKLSVRCGENCRGEFIADALKRQTPGTWRTIGVPLKCFAKAGANMTKLDAIFELSTYGKLDISISKVELGTVADERLSC